MRKESKRPKKYDDNFILTSIDIKFMKIPITKNFAIYGLPIFSLFVIPAIFIFKNIINNNELTQILIGDMISAGIFVIAIPIAIYKIIFMKKNGKTYKDIAVINAKAKRDVYFTERIKNYED